MSTRRRRHTAPVSLSQAIIPAVTGPKPAESSAPPAGEGGGEQSPPPSNPTAESAPAPSQRRRRANVGGHAMKLAAPQREGETRRWVNDDGNRIAELRELGYDFVSETGIQTSDPGSRVSRLVGTKANGEPLHAYLMETPDELYAEGVAEREAANRQIDEAITAGRDSTGRMDENQYGHGSIKVDR
jgi:hypothetical protein